MRGLFLPVGKGDWASLREGGRKTSQQSNGSDSARNKEFFDLRSVTTIFASGQLIREENAKPVTEKCLVKTWFLIKAYSSLKSNARGERQKSQKYTDNAFRTSQHR